MAKTLNRSFGFNFKDKFIQGTAILKEDGQNDIHSFLDNKEFPSLNDLFAELNLTEQEKSEFIGKLNKFVNSQN